MTAILVLLVQALVSVPALVAGLTGRGGRIAAVFYLLVGGAALGASLTLAPGLPSPAEIAAASGADAPAAKGGTVTPPSPGTEACTKLIDAMKDSGVIVDTSSPPKVVVNGLNWNRIPEQYRKPVLDCVAQAQPPGSGEPQIVRQ